MKLIFSLIKFSIFLFFICFPIISFGAIVNFSADTALQFNPAVSPQILVASSSACDNLTLSGTNLNVLIPAGSSFQLKNSNHSLIKLTPSGGSVELVLNVAPSSQEYVSGYLVKWQASSTVSNATVAFEVGVSKANTYYQVNVDGSYFGSYQSNSSGIISFTYNGGFSTKTFTIEEDVSAPSSFSLVSPANGSNVTDKTPTFSWNASSDTDLSHYQLYLDGSLLADNLTSTSYTPSSNLSCGSHTWYVKAVDDAGNTTESSSFSFKVLCGVVVLPMTVKPTTTSTPTTPSVQKGSSQSEFSQVKEVQIKQIKSQIASLYKKVIVLLQKQVIILLQKLYLELLKKHPNSVT